MLFNEFSQNYFIPADERQLLIVEDFKKIRSLNGIPHRLKILRSLAKTNTHTVYPPGWKFV